MSAWITPASSGDAAPARARPRRVKFTVSAGVEYSGKPTEFHGYDSLTLEGTVVALYREGASVEEIAAAIPQWWCSTARRSTPIRRPGGRPRNSPRERQLQRRGHAEIQAEVFGHKGEVKAGRLRIGDRVMAAVDSVARARARGTTPPPI